MYSPNGDFLLIERADRAGYWQSVTGSLDDVAEPPEQAAIRELSEETGFTAQLQQTPGVLQANPTELNTPGVLRPWPKQVQYEIFEHWRHRYAPGVTHNTEHWFAVCLPSNAKPLLAPREHTGYAWLSAEQAAARCFSPNNAQAILDLHQRLKASG